jgi:phosphoribosylformylglycinamidine cyclo-ligase
MTYAGTGVDYNAMDPFKRMAQAAARETNLCVEDFGFSLVPWTRGESITLLKTPIGYFGLVVEGLGTKNIVADVMYELDQQMGAPNPRTWYDMTSRCNVAMAANDAITLGARPICYGQYTAVDEGGWFDHQQRSRDLIEGTKEACLESGCTWVGGETPTLRDIIMPGKADLAGGMIGFIAREEWLQGPHRIQDGDAIVLVESSGIHANGLTLARAIAAKLDQGYLTRLPDGRTYGETLLDPTIIYVPLLRLLQDHGVELHYGVNITGHGWRKLMRAPQPFTYVVERVPKPPLIFEAIQKYGPVDDKEAYGNLNMGAGFAFYMPASEAWKALVVLEESEYADRFKLLIAGSIESSPEKKVVIKPKGIVFEADSLQVR